MKASLELAVVLAAAAAGCKPAATGQADAAGWMAPYCRNCTANRDCGDPKDFCVVATPGAQGQCGIDCSAEQVCPPNSYCTPIIVQGNTAGMNCIADLGLPCGSRYCQPCTANSQCGAAGNFCVDLGTAVVCGSDCDAGQTCPPGSACVPILVNGVAAGNNCVPDKTAACLGIDAGSDAGTGDGG